MCGLPARLEVNAISPPLGLQAGSVSIPAEVVSRRRPEPSRLQRKISALPLTERENTTRRPSGENDGEVLSGPSASSARLAPLARSTRNRLGGPSKNET